MIIPETSGGGTPPAATTRWEAGHLVLGEFLVERSLGFGGFGEVVLTRSNRSGEQFAVKRARIAVEAARARFLSEVRNWINLTPHPNLAACRFVRSVGSEVAIFAEFIPGGSLSDWLRDGRLYAGSAEERLARALDIAIQTAWGLAAVHDAGLIHLDVKPANVLLTPEGVAKVADFGLAAGWDTSSEAQSTEMVLDYMLHGLGADEKVKAALRKALRREPNGLTAVPGGGAFTGAYASPEQAEGCQMTRRSDVWSWGLTVLEMFAGARTWPSGTLAAGVLETLLGSTTSRRAMQLPQRVAEVLRQCFREKPEERWVSLQEAAGALVVAHRMELGRNYPRQAPTEPAASPTGVPDARVHVTGSSWRDPREWLDLAFRSAGQERAEAFKFWPARTGTRKARLFADLQALEKARNVLRGAADARTDMRLAQASGQLSAEIATVHASLGDFAGAALEYERAIAELEVPDNPDARLDLSLTLNSAAILLRNRGERDAAMRNAERSVELAERLARDGNERAKGQLATSLHTLGNCALSLDHDLGRGVALYDRALSLLDEKTAPVGVAKLLGSKASALRNAAEAEAMWARTDALLTCLVNEGRTDLRHVLAGTKLTRAQTLAPSDPKKATLYEEAIATYTELVVVEGRSDFAGELGAAYFSVGTNHELLSRRRAALESYGRAREFLTQAVVQEGRSDLSDELARATQYESTIAATLGNVPGAIELSQRAVELWGTLVRLEGKEVWGFELANATATLGKNLAKSGDFGAALNHLGTAIAGLQQAAGHRGETDKIALAMALMERGIIFQKQGAPERSSSAHQEALGVVRPLRTSEGRHTTALILLNLSYAIEDARDYESSLAPIREAISIWSSLVEGGEANHSEDLAAAYQNHSAKLMKLGDEEAALDLANRSLALYETLVPHYEHSHVAGEMARALFLKGRLLEKLFRPGEAIASYKRAIEIEARAPAEIQASRPPEFRNFLAGRIQELQALVGWTGADFARWIATADEDVSAAKAYGQSGDRHMACEFLDSAIGIYTQLERVAPDPRLREAAARAYLLKGMAAMDARRSRGAGNAFQRAIDLYEGLRIEAGRIDLIELWTKAHMECSEFHRTLGNESAAAAVLALLDERLQTLDPATRKRAEGVRDAFVKRMRARQDQP
jgi:serine/threonine protein kinase